MLKSEKEVFLFLIFILFQGCVFVLAFVAFLDSNG